MKNFILGLLASLLLFIVGYSIYCNCDSIAKTVQQETVEQKTDVFTPVVFNSIDEVLDLQMYERQNAHIDSVFLSLPPKILEAVTAVCLRNNGQLTKQQIAKEYERNQNIYVTLYNSEVIPKTNERVLPEDQIFKKLDTIKHEAPTPPDGQSNGNNTQSPNTTTT